MALNTLLVLLSSINIAVATQEGGMDTQIVAPVLVNARTVPVLQDPSAQQSPLPPDFAKQIREQTKQIQDQFGPDFQKKMEAQAKKWAEQSKLFQDQFGPKFQKQMEEQAKKWAEQSKLFQDQFGPKFQKQTEEQAKKWAEQSKSLKDQFGPDFEKKMEEQAKKWAEQSKSWKDQFGPDFEKKMEEQSKRFSEEFGPKFQKEMEGQFGPDFQERMGDFGKEWSKRGSGIKKFLGSITQSQRDLMKKRGYLGWNDLTSEQQSFLGEKPDGKFEIRYTVDGGDVVIRGK